MSNVTRKVNRHGYTYVWPITLRAEREENAQKAADAHARNRKVLDRIAARVREDAREHELYGLLVKARADKRRARRAETLRFNLSRSRLGGAW